MRILNKLLLYLIIFAFMGVEGQGLGFAQSEPNNNKLTEIIGNSCQKACTGNAAERAFCMKYCQCVSSKVKNLASQTDISKILNSENKKTELIHHCSGEIALRFFAQSCRDKCQGAAECDGFCACLEKRLQHNQSFPQIGAFFMKLGEKEPEAIEKLKRIEAACFS